MAIVSTGQITLVDNNDARPLTAYITVTPGTQQIYSKDESVVSWTPDWLGGPSAVLTARVYAGATGAADDVTGLLTNRKWALDVGGTAITGSNAAMSTNSGLNAAFFSGTFTAVHNSGGSTLTFNGNLKDTTGQLMVYFEGDYTDPVTGLVSHIIAQIQLTIVRTGTNAVWVNTRGMTAIEQATGNTKNVAVVVADLVRAAGIDTTGVTYRFFENYGATQIYNAAPFNTEYGMKSTGATTAPTATPATIGTGLPSSGGWSSNNTLVIHESAVADMGVYRVEAKDADGTIYQTFFTIFDISDPYDVKVNSSAGDKLQNGVGSTNFTPAVYYGSSPVSDLTGWTFTWTMFNRDGKRVAFVDATRTALAGGRTITTHTTGTAAVFTYSGTAITFAAGDLIKAVAPSGQESIYEVASATGNTVTIRAPSTNSGWLSFTAFAAPAASQFTNGKLFVCRNNQGQVVTSGAAALLVTGDDVDVKATFYVDANRP